MLFLFDLVTTFVIRDIIYCNLALSSACDLNIFNFLLA